VDPRTFSVNAMLADMESLLRRLTGGHVELGYVQAAGLWAVQLPPGKLEEVLLALVVDACDAMPVGGHLRITTANVSGPDGRPSGDYVQLTVSDTARTVSDAVRSAIRGRGTREGLGIRLSFELAERADGHVDVMASAEGGLTVRLLLPRADTPLSVRELGEAAELVGGTETILFVEDDRSLASVAGRVLARLGYRVLTAASGEAALRVLAEHPEPLHLLFTDLVLPGMDGVDLARQVKQRRPDIKVLFTSGYSQESLRLRDAVGEDVRFLEKPFSLSGLASALRAALG